MFNLLCLFVFLSLFYQCIRTPNTRLPQDQTSPLPPASLHNREAHITHFISNNMALNLSTSLKRDFWIICLLSNVTSASLNPLVLDSHLSRCREQAKLSAWWTLIHINCFHIALITFTKHLVQASFVLLWCSCC